MVLYVLTGHRSPPKFLLKLYKHTIEISECGDIGTRLRYVYKNSPLMKYNFK